LISTLSIQLIKISTISVELKQAKRYENVLPVLGL